MTIAIKHIIRFFLFALIQVLVLNQIEIGWGIQLMIYPVFIMLLPVELSVFYLLLISFLFGMFIDSMSNSYGLHTSALLLFAYLRPLIFKVFAKCSTRFADLAGQESLKQNSWSFTNSSTLLHAGQFVGGTICLKVSLSPKYDIIISNE